MRAAVEPLTRALEIRPKSPVILLARAMTWSQIGEHEKAVADFTACIRLRPRLFEAWFNRAASLADLQRFEEAVRDCDEALKLVPDHPRLLANRALGRAALGDKEGGVGGGEAAVNAFSYENNNEWKTPPMVSKMVGIKLKKGERVRLQTPGGGGFGPSKS